MNWNELIKIFDILAAITIIVCLCFVVRYRIAWLVYSFGCILFVIVGGYKGLIGLCIMNVIACGMGIRNYLIQKKEKKKKLNKKQLKIILGIVNTTLAEYCVCPSCMKKVYSKDDDCSIHTCYDSGFQKKLLDGIKESNI